MTESFFANLKFHVFFAVTSLTIILITYVVINLFSFKVYNYHSSNPSNVPGGHYSMQRPHARRRLIIINVIVPLLISIGLINILLKRSDSIKNGTDVFVLFYIITPIMITIAVFLLGDITLSWGLFTIAKALFYIFLATISTIEYLNVEETNFGKIALGLTLSIAIFEGIASIVDGIMKIISK